MKLIFKIFFFSILSVIIFGVLVGLWVLIYNPENIIKPPGLLILMSLFLSWYMIFKKKYIDNYIKSPMKIIFYTLFIVLTILLVNLFNSHFFSEKYQKEQVINLDSFHSDPTSSLVFLKKDTSLLNGIVEIYFENGQLGWSGKFKNGKGHGIFEDYHENGQIRIRSKFKNGRLNGINKTYYENGQLKFESNWKNHKYHGTERGWYESGEIRYESKWKNDQYHGTKRDWYKNGQLKEEKTYNYGNLVSQNCFNNYGKKIKCE